MAAEASRSGGPADSYIGSLISLTSKSEIRYEGVLYNINTEESSIGLRNVRSFGTEGRKKDGLQVPPNDKVYEYILFRGSDIKDLQVKSSPTVQPTPPIHNDPAIIQSHYSHPAPASTTLPAAGSGPVTEIGSQTAQLGLPRSTFQGGLPLYQPGGNLASWGSSPPPPSANGTGLAMPMYWQGFYGPPSGLPPHMQQQSLLRPPPGLSMPHSMQQQPMQFPGMSTSMQPTGAPNLPTSNLVDFPPPLLPPVSSGPLNLTSSTLASNLPSTLASAHSAALASETSPSLITTKAPIAAFSTATSSASLPLVSPLTTSSLDKSATSIPPTSNKPKTVPGPSLPYQTVTQSVSSTVGTSSSSSHHGASTPLVTPGKLLQPGPPTLSSSQSSQPTRPTTLSASQSSQPAHKDVVVVQVSSSQTLPSASTELQAPILPLPSLPDQKPSRAPLHTHHNHGYRGRERGRGNGISRPVTKFTEEFDFIAMNEKFKKDEVWGHLGKSNKAQFRDKQGDGNEDDEDYPEDEDYTGPSKSEEKPVYVKDDFFDTLSSNALDNASRAGRTKFSEQMKIDSETFGDFPRHNRGGRGGRGGPGRGGRSWNPHYGRGYGYVGRGRGRNMPGRGY